MKKPPNGMKDMTERHIAENRLLMPLSILLFALAFFTSNGIFIRMLMAGLLGFGGYNLFKYLVRYKKELHGAALRKFKKVCAELFVHACDKDLVSAVSSIAVIATLMETKFHTAHKCLQRNMYIFGSPLANSRIVEANTYLLNHAVEIEQVFVVLHVSEGALPEYLTSPYDHIRQAAIVRMTQLQKRDGSEGTLDLS